MTTESRLRVLQVGKFYAPYRGGMETHLKHLCDELRHVVDVEVLVANPARETVHEVVDGVPVTRVASHGRLRATSIAPGYLGELARTRADVVHLHAPNPVAELALLAWARPRRVKVVVTWHSDVVRQRLLARLYRPVSRRLLARADAVCVATPNHVRASAILPDYAVKCRTCAFGVDLDALRPDPRAIAAARARFGARPIVLGVGRLVYYKGFEVLLDAMAGLDATLVIAGEGERRPALEARLRALGIADRVFLVGEQDDLRPLFGACDVFVLPSTHRSEAFGIVQLEAMAFAKPVVSTRLGTGVDWVNAHGVTGLTVPPGEAPALREAIATLLASPALRARLGANGRRRVEQEYTTARAAESVLAVYRELMGWRGPGGRTADGRARDVA
jgi:rhamnosyl/mannosyltransferase